MTVPSPTPSDTIRTRLAFAFEAAETEEDRAWVNEAQEALAMMESEVARLRRALEECHDQFASYGAQHMRKDQPDEAKATTNYKMAAMCKSALAQPGDAA